MRASAQPFSLGHEGYSRVDPLEVENVFRSPSLVSPATLHSWVRARRLHMSRDGRTAAVVDEAEQGMRRVLHSAVGVVGPPFPYRANLRVLRVTPERVEVHVEDKDHGEVLHLMDAEATHIQSLDHYERSVETQYAPMHIGRMNDAHPETRRYIYHGRALDASVDASLTILEDQFSSVRVLDRDAVGRWSAFTWSGNVNPGVGSQIYPLPFQADRVYPIVGKLWQTGRHEMGYLTTNGLRGAMVFPQRDAPIPLQGWVEWAIPSPKGNGWAMLMQMPGMDDVVPTRKLVVTGLFPAVSREGSFSLDQSDFVWAPDGRSFVAKYVHSITMGSGTTVIEDVIMSGDQREYSFGPFAKVYESRVDGRGNVAAILEDATGRRVFVNGSITDPYPYAWNLRIRDGLVTCNVYADGLVQRITLES